MMKQISLAKFLEGYEKGCISDVVFLKDKIYGKDSRALGSYDIVWAVVT